MKTTPSIFLSALLALALVNIASAQLLSVGVSGGVDKINHVIERNDDATKTTYTPDWKSLDKRPLPEWYDDAKFGIFMHWGVYSVPSFGNEWFWDNWHNHNSRIDDFMKKNYPPTWKYQDFVSQFHAELFNASKWIDLFQKAGAKYISPTAKHHEGFCLWNSAVSWNWNSVTVGPHRDLLGELRDAIAAKNAEFPEKSREMKAGDDIPMHFGLYHSLFEWFNPLYLQDKSIKFNSSTFVDRKTMPELRDLIENYRPEYIFSDGDWEASYTYWKSREFLAWVYNESPVKDTIVVNDRWGKGTSCKHGDVWNCADRYNPGHLVEHKWENAFTIDKHSWGYSRLTTYEQYMSIAEILEQFISTIAHGGNVLLDVGPTADGRILPIFEERLLQMGEFLGINGEAVYRSRVWSVSQRDSINKNVYYTIPKTLPAGSSAVVYAFFLDWPSNNTLILKDLDVSKYRSSHLGHIRGVQASFLGTSARVRLSRRPSEAGVEVKLPQLPPSSENKLLLNQAAWVIKFNFVTHSEVSA